MYAYHLSKIALVAALAGLAGCASQPSRINDVCAVFAQNDGWVRNWQRSAYAAERKYGIPVPVLMATVRKESGFKSDARPPRKKILGFIPGKRASSAYGYSQALNGTWAQYVSESGNFGARRASFHDAIDFVGWYHAKTVSKYGVAPGDMYSLYLAYYHGWGGYAKGSWRNNASIMNYARQADDMARKYSTQLQGCR